MGIPLRYCTPFFIAAIFIFIVALLSYRRRLTRGGWFLTLVCLSAALWAASEGLLYLGFDLETNLRITYIQYLGITPLPPLALLFSLAVFGTGDKITRPLITALTGMAALIITLVWTNDLHNLVFSNHYVIDAGDVPMIGLDHGPVWWVIIGYHYFLLAVLSIVLIRHIFASHRFHRPQAAIVLAAVSIVWVVNIFYVSGNSPVPNMDISPLAFSLVAVSMAWGFFRYSLLDIAPIAKTMVFQGLTNPILVLDEKNRIVDINPAAETMFNLKPGESMGKTIRQVITDFPPVQDLPNDEPVEISLPLDNRNRFFNLHLSTLHDRRGTLLGRVIVLYDTTAMRQTAEALQEKEKMQGVFELAGAVSHELNQPLMSILGYAELVAMKIPFDDPMHKDIEKLFKEVENLGRITRKLMTITRYETKNYLDRKIIDIDKSSKNSAK